MCLCVVCVCFFVCVSLNLIRSLQLCTFTLAIIRREGEKGYGLKFYNYENI